MIKAKINEQGVFEINRGGQIIAMRCPFGQLNCNLFCPFFEYNYNLINGSNKYGASWQEEITLTCTEKEKIFRYKNSEFLFERNNNDKTSERT